MTTEHIKIGSILDWIIVRVDQDDARQFPYFFFFFIVNGLRVDSFLVPGLFAYQIQQRRRNNMEGTSVKAKVSSTDIASLITEFVLRNTKTTSRKLLTFLTASLFLFRMDVVNMS